MYNVEDIKNEIAREWGAPDYKSIDFYQLDLQYFSHEPRHALEIFYVEVINRIQEYHEKEKSTLKRNENHEINN